MKLLEGLSIRSKLVVLWLIPLPLLAYLLFATVSARITEHRDATNIHRLSLFAHELVELIGTMQVERGMALGYLGSQGRLFAGDLERQAQRTDEVLEATAERADGLGLDELGREYQGQYEVAIAEAEALLAGRGAIRRRATPADQVFRDYSGVINQLIGLVGSTSSFSTDASLGEMFHAFEAFLEHQEGAAQERGVLTHAFAADRFEPGMFEHLGYGLSTQAAFKEIFLSHATPEQKEVYERLSNKIVADEKVEAMREVALEKATAGGFAVDAAEWFRRRSATSALVAAVPLQLAGQLSDYSEDLQREASWVLTWLLALTLATLVLTLVLTFAISRMISQSVTETFRDAAHTLASASGQLLEVASEQASGAQSQVAAVEQTGTSVAEVAQISEQSVQRAQAVAEAARRADDIGKVGSQAVKEAVTAMGLTKSQADATAENILSLAERTQAIGEIIESVTEIAEQTNLLALNAAIEASRAGEHGKGFAVVAGEVKALAGQAKGATAQVRQILEEIQGATNAAVMSTEQGTKRVHEALTVVAQAGDTITQLTDTVSESYQLSTQISASATQQAAGLSQIQDAMKGIAAVASTALAASERAMAAAEELNSLSGDLEHLVGGAKVSPGNGRA